MIPASPSRQCRCWSHCNNRLIVLSPLTAHRFARPRATTLPSRQLLTHRTIPQHPRCRPRALESVHTSTGLQSTEPCIAVAAVEATVCPVPTRCHVDRSVCASNELPWLAAVTNHHRLEFGTTCSKCAGAACANHIYQPWTAWRQSWTGGFRPSGSVRSPRAGALQHQQPCDPVRASVMRRHGKHRLIVMSCNTFVRRSMRWLRGTLELLASCMHTSCAAVRTELMNVRD